MIRNNVAQPVLDGFASMELGNEIPLLMCRYHPDLWYPGAAADAGIALPEGLERARPKRLTEYLAGRVLAHRLLRQHGCEGTIGRNPESRAPVWPTGYVGSITHSSGLAACCVLPQSVAAGVGIDLEHWLTADTAARVGDRIWGKDEARVFEEQGWDTARALTVVFSAKESLFKALYPLCRRFFGFEAARVCDLKACADGGQLELVLAETLSKSLCSGIRFRVDFRELDQHVLTGVRLGPGPPE